jgi:hypothetical protein
MLETDALHRRGQDLEPRFRALVRWAAAEANRCDYAQAMAHADYRRDTEDQTDLAALAGYPDALSERERRSIAFARKMMHDAASVRDEEVAWLKDDLGEQRLVALVLLLAHASFQDRMLLALGLTAEPDSVPPPVQTRFAQPRPASPPKHLTSERPWLADLTSGEDPPAWAATRVALEMQKHRPGRLAIPSVEAMTQLLGPEHPVLWQRDIVWSRLCYVHQPQPTDAWFATVAAARSESSLDPVFTNSIFWVVTDSLRCFY